MSNGSRVRELINRDSGIFIRVGNHDLRWYQIVGCVAMVGAFLALHIQKFGVEVTSWVAWSTLVVGALFFAAPWRIHSDPEQGTPEKEPPMDGGDQRAV